MLKNFTREEKSWMLYDWANSAHTVIIVTLLPIFYATVASYTANSGSAMSTWGYVTSAAMLICAVLAPLLGAIGDFRGYRKKLFVAFLAVGVLACAGLALTPLTNFFDDPEKAARIGLVILILYVVSQIGYSAANLYYDSFLTDVTTEERMDRVSTMGYGLGYIGGSTIPLLAFLVLNLIGVDVLYCLSFAFGFTAIWWAAFSWPLIANVDQKSYVEQRPGAVRDALRGLRSTVKEIAAHKSILVFLIAYFFYIDGVGTIIHMSTIYGDTLGLDSTMMMLAMLVVQLLGLPFCLLYIHLAERYGARRMVGCAIIVYMLICVFGFFVRSVWQFWVLAILVSTSQGGIQALSRSMFGKMIPDKNRTGEFFGFYDIFGKFSSIMGPAVVAFFSAVAANVFRSRGTVPEELIDAASAPWGVLSILLIFFIGGGLYFFVLPKYLEKE